MLNFHDLLKLVMDRCFKKGTISHKPTYTWFTPALRSMRNSVNASYKRHRKNLENLIYRGTYILKRRQYKKSVGEAKRKSRLAFCKKTQDVYGSLFKYISGKASHYRDVIFTTLENSQVFDSYDDIARSLMSAHCNIDEIPEYYPSQVSDFTYNGNIDFPLIGDR